MDTTNFNLWKILEQLLAGFIAVVPNLLGAFAVLIIGLIVSKMSRRLVRKMLKSIGADQLAERLNEIELLSNNNIRLIPSKLLSTVVYYFLLFIFVVAATDILNMEVISVLVGDILNYVPVVISALAVLVIGLFISDFLKNIVKTACDSLAIPAAGLISNIVFYFLFLNVVMIALAQAKIDTGFIQDNLSIILAGIVFAFAIGYGFASRNIVANFLASFYNKGKVSLGDHVEIDGVAGKVIALDSSTITLDAKDRRVIIPLSKLTDKSIAILKSDAPA
ncbi:MAG: mechanosensitive ion channel [bacterium]|nr:mechanosensitive ion channel [bacterium]